MFLPYHILFPTFIRSLLIQLQAPEPIVVPEQLTPIQTPPKDVKNEEAVKEEESDAPVASEEAPVRQSCLDLLRTSRSP